jgi:octaheme c-type cytochrome (tetrathionate reductase family)
MKKRFPFWILGLIGIVLVIVASLVLFLPKPAEAIDDPWAGLPEHPVHVDHKDIVKGPFATGQEVTAACLACHSDSADEMMVTTHFTWESKPFDVPGRDQPVTIGKANQLNNFCISAQGNQKKCMSCHTGYGWQEGGLRLHQPLNVDCLACHADRAVYGKGEYGDPAEGVDLLAAAQSVRAPTRENCGACHFNGGGGNAVKHGDLDESLYYPDQELDVHMGEYDFICTDCHTTENHLVKGRLVVDNYQVDPTEQVSCTQCHSNAPHEDERINTHLDSVACQTCHVPAYALQNPTKLTWDWSTAGQDRRRPLHLPEDQGHLHLRQERPARIPVVQRQP